MNRILFILIPVMIAAGCEPKSKAIEQPIIDVDGLIDRQLGLLAKRKPVLTKLASIDDDESDTTFAPGTDSWRTELEIYRSLGMLNQRVYAGTYTAEGPMDDPQSNLLIQRYANNDAPLKWVRIYYQEKPERIRQIEGEFQESTPLFTSSRRLTLWFDMDRGQPILARYQLTGFQKTALRDTVRFRNQGVVQW